MVVPNSTQVRRPVGARWDRQRLLRLEQSMWNKNERNGNLDQVKGKVKQAVGELTGNDRLKVEGKVDETIGQAKTAVGGAEKKVAAAVASVKNAAKR